MRGIVSSPAAAAQLMKDLLCCRRPAATVHPAQRMSRVRPRRPELGSTSGASARSDQQHSTVTHRLQNEPKNFESLISMEQIFLLPVSE